MNQEICHHFDYKYYNLIRPPRLPPRTPSSKNPPPLDLQDEFTRTNLNRNRISRYILPVDYSWSVRPKWAYKSGISGMQPDSVSISPLAVNDHEDRGCSRYVCIRVGATRSELLYLRASL